MEKSLIIAIAIGAVLAIGVNGYEKMIYDNFWGCNNNVCDGVPNNTAIPNEISCEHFFICIDGRALPNTCPPGQWFNGYNRQCDNSTSPCEFDFECPSSGVYFFPHEDYCHKFIMCFAGVPILQTCAEGLHFDRKLGQCNFPEYAECGPRTCPPENDPEDIVFLPSEYHCDKFYICYSGEPIGFWCPEGLYFNPKLNTCDFKENLNCTIDGPPRPPGPPSPHDIDCDPDEAFYFVPHPNSCEHYFICSFGESILLPCAPGFHFDPVYNWCDYPEIAQCETNTTTTARPGTTTTRPGTTTHAPTTTRPPCQNPGFNCSDWNNDDEKTILREYAPIVLNPAFIP